MASPQSTVHSPTHGFPGNKKISNCLHWWPLVSDMVCKSCDWSLMNHCFHCKQASVQARAVRVGLVLSIKAGRQHSNINNLPGFFHELMITSQSLQLALGWNTSLNNMQMKNCTDLNLGELVYISIVYHIQDSRFFIEWLWFFVFDCMKVQISNTNLRKFHWWCISLKRWWLNRPRSQYLYHLIVLLGHISLVFI